ncbi:hypothetical protein SOV_11450 [Sporomusa ovata DSM 2662]|nr:DUF6056 family protein [Sporomusa ovata]EQB28768.1 hypothetical protein SOV_1c04830 [Sporomusa ovata DSM 2662]
MMRSMTKDPIISVFILLILYGYILSLNLLAPLMVDDYMYSFHWNTYDRITGFSDIISSQVDHYFTHGGRMVAEGLTQVFLYIGKDFFAVTNSFVFIFLVALIYWHSQGKVSLRFQPILLLLIVFLCWFCIPRIGETVIWLTGAFNYLWTTVFVLLFLLPYRLKIEGKLSFNSNNNIIAIGGMFLWGIVSGWTNEHIGLSLVLATFWFNYYFLKKNMHDKWMVSGLIGAVIGYLMLMLAPGNYVRSADITHKANYSFIHNNLHSTLETSLHLFIYYIPLFILLFVIYKIIVRNSKTIKNNLQSTFYENRTTFVSSIFFITISLSTHFAMLAAPEYPQRAGFPSAVFLIIGVLGFLRLKLIHAKILTGKGRNIIISMLVLVTFPLAYITLQAHMTLYTEHKQRVEFVMMNKAQGIDELSIKPFTVKDKTIMGHIFAKDLTDDSNTPRNKFFANYYGIKSIKVIQHQ